MNPLKYFAVEKQTVYYEHIVLDMRCANLNFPALQRKKKITISNGIFLVFVPSVDVSVSCEAFIV